VKGLVELLRGCGALKHGDFTLASGRRSNYYVDLRLALTEPGVLRRLAAEMAPHVRGCERIAGVELAAVPLAAAVSLETGIPYLMVRKKPKGHGTERGYEGTLPPGATVVFVEDTVTTGGTLLRAIGALRSEGARVERAVCVVDREEGATEVLAAAGVELRALLRARDLLAGA
jgi:orotate phosphoribosyltransferase